MASGVASPSFGSEGSTATDERHVPGGDTGQTPGWFETLVENAHDPVIVVDQMGAVRYWNPAAERAFGYAREEMLGLPIGALMPARLRKEQERWFQGFAGSTHTPAKSRVIELGAIRKDGVEFPLRLSMSSWTRGGNRFFTGIAHDMTYSTRQHQELVRYADEVTESRDVMERQTATLVDQAAAIRRSQERLRLVLDGTEYTYWDWDIQTGQAFFSARFWTSLGLSPCKDSENTENNACPVSTWLNRVSTRDCQGLSAALTAHFEGSARNIIFEHRLQHADGHWIWFLVRGQVAERASDGRALRATGVLADISERKRLEDEVQHSNKLEAVGQLAAGIAHEINTPIQYIGDNLQYLLDEHQGDGSDVAAQVDDAHTERMMAIRESIEGVGRVGRIVQAMKEFAHPGTEEKQSVDLNHFINSTITLARNEWKYVANIHRDLDPTLPLVSCIPGEINQAVLNLLVNAAHAIGELPQTQEGVKGTISIRTTHRDGWAQFSISDTGGGIPRAIRSRVFEPFFTTKDVGKGTGQGLVLVHTIITNHHGGEVSFASKVGLGTTFTVRIPIDSDDGRNLP
jgi:PAS domain S-box-containing protein